MPDGAHMEGESRRVWAPCPAPDSQRPPLRRMENAWTDFEFRNELHMKNRGPTDFRGSGPGRAGFAANSGPATSILSNVAARQN